jgi:hypothetical protein
MAIFIYPVVVVAKASAERNSSGAFPVDKRDYQAMIDLLLNRGGRPKRATM